MSEAIDAVEALVLKTAQEAIKDDTTQQSRIDALRSMAPYYAALKKAQGHEPPESDEPTMEDMRREIEKENGNGRSVQAGGRSRN